MNFSHSIAAPVAAPESPVDRSVLARVAAYKKWTAGAYESVTPHEISTRLAADDWRASEKIDGETWFLCVRNGDARLVSPAGKLLDDIPLTHEAAELFEQQNILLAGELYADAVGKRPRVYDLAACLGNGTSFCPEHLRFAAFDVLEADGEDVQLWPFPKRAEFLSHQLASGALVHSVNFQSCSSAAEIASFYKSIVAQGGEGVVARSGGRILKIKPEISIDAAVVGYAADADGAVRELLLALRRPEGDWQLLGRVYNGFAARGQAELGGRLSALCCPSHFRMASKSGALYRLVCPELVVEIKCNDILTERSGGESIRRMALAFDEDNGWSPLAPRPFVSLLHAVFKRVRADKNLDGADLSQVLRLAPRLVSEAPEAPKLPKSTLLRREAYAKSTKHGIAVKKVVAWKTNKRDVDDRYPPYVAFFTDYSSARAATLKTDIRVASSLEKIHGVVDAWLADNIKRGWETRACVKAAGDGAADDVEAISAPQGPDIDTSTISLTISFARSTSPSLPLAERRMKALAPLGALQIEKDEKEKEILFRLEICSGLVENAARILSLVQLVRQWKSAEIAWQGDALSRRELDDFLFALQDLRKCARLHEGKCCADIHDLGCGCVRLQTDFAPFANASAPAWFAVGKFENGAVHVNKAELLVQNGASKNHLLSLCPNWRSFDVEANIEKLPAVLDPAADERWKPVYDRNGAKPAWVAPAGLQRLPWPLTFEAPVFSRVAVIGGETDARTDVVDVSTPPERRVPKISFADVCGQDAAVAAVRDLVELPLRRADWFEHMGVSAPRGLILHGPPGNGKTLLAKAVAGESDAHVEIVSGPELLSKWVGESEERLRTIFERARELAPTVILFDELDAIAGSRDNQEGSSKMLVSQLLVLLDGLEDRGDIFVIGTTNRPGDIDAALKRPGRFEEFICVGPPDAKGRAAIYQKYLARMPGGKDIDPKKLAEKSPGFSGAQIEAACRKAGVARIKRANAKNISMEKTKITARDLLRAVEKLAAQIESAPPFNIPSRANSCSAAPTPDRLVRE